MSLDTSSSKNDDISFIDGDEHISFDYHLLKKHSTYIQAIEWDVNDSKCLTLPQIGNYKSKEVAEHLQYMLLQLRDENPTLQRENHAEFPQIKRIGGNIANLEIYLHLASHLQLNVFINQIVDTLRSYTPELTEFKTYMDIYTSILLPRKMDGFKKLAIIIGNHPFDYQITPELEQIGKMLLDEPKLSLYDRCLVAIKLHFPLPVDIDAITARQIYVKTNGTVICPSIENELPLIKSTQDVVIDSITKYRHAIRIPLEESKHGGLFYFHVHGYTRNGYIDLGQVTLPGGDVYSVYLEKNHLFTVDEFKAYHHVSDPKKQNILNTKYRDIYVSSERYCEVLHRCFGNIKSEEQMDIEIEIFRHYQQEDTLFRQHLHHLGLLTDEEIMFLYHRLQIDKDYPLINQIEKPGPKHWTDKYTKNVMEETYPICRTPLPPGFIESQNLESSYYSSDVGKELEEQRKCLRYNFFSNRYTGLIIVLYFYDIYAIDELSKRIILDQNLGKCEYTNKVYHTPFLPSNRNVDRSQFRWTSSFLTYLYAESHGVSKCERYIQHLSLCDGVSQAEPNTLLLNSTTQHPGFEFLTHIDDEDEDEDEDEDINVDFLTLYSFSLLDPSTIPNIEEVIKNSKFSTATEKPLIMSHPPINPKFYFKAGIQKYGDKYPYIGNVLEPSLYLRGEVKRFVRSDVNTLN
jgi:hypothetical protein